jgi:hypothetical protein
MILFCLGMLIAGCLLASGLTIASSVLQRSTQLAREVATRRILGARRSDIVALFLLENLPGYAMGVAVGGLALLAAGALLDLVSLSVSVALVTCATVVGGLLAARHAATTPFGKSGLFSEPASRCDARGAGPSL